MIFGNTGMQRHSALRLAILSTLSLSLPTHAQSINEMGANERGVEELRNTLVNVMEALVQKGVLTREQAQQIVASAQTKTAAAAKEQSIRDADEKDAVRVTYVPENIKAEIGNQVAAQLKPSVVNEVVAQAKNEKWGVPGALPEWVSNLNLYGDVRMRAEQAAYGADNAQFVYLNFDTVNTAGGVGKAGTSALLNVSEDRFRTLIRARLGVLADLGGSFKADLRLTSGTGRNVNSTNQTLGAYNARGGINLDKAALIWDHISQSVDQEFEIRAGRFGNPYNVNSELVWDNDLTFEGVSATYAMDLFGRKVNKLERGLYLTVGAMPLQEVELSNKDKWLYAAQLGTEVPFATSAVFKLSGAYYNYQNIAGTKNVADSTLLDYTAPRFLSKGNTLFEIRNSTTDTSVNLYALAADYKLADANLSVDFPVAHKRVIIAAEYVRNIGFDRARILERIGSDVEGKTNGYDVSLTVGDASLKAFGNWRAMFGYRYVERDAVLDAFTDSDFRLGGTDAKGYQFAYELGLSRNTSLKARMMSATEIDGPPLAIDVYHLDFNGSF
jgi:Putative porin